MDKHIGICVISKSTLVIQDKTLQKSQTELVKKVNTNTQTPFYFCRFFYSLYFLKMDHGLNEHLKTLNLNFAPNFSAEQHRY